MLTRDDAMTLNTFYHAKLRNSDGTALRVRRNGRTQTWKRSPHRWRVPVKYGLYRYLDITDTTAADWLPFDPTTDSGKLRAGQVVMCTRLL